MGNESGQEKSLQKEVLFSHFGKKTMRHEGTCETDITKTSKTAEKVSNTPMEVAPDLLKKHRGHQLLHRSKQIVCRTPCKLLQRSTSDILGPT